MRMEGDRLKVGIAALAADVASFEVHLSLLSGSDVLYLMHKHGLISEEKIRAAIAAAARGGATMQGDAS